MRDKLLAPRFWLGTVLIYCIDNVSWPQFKQEDVKCGP
jgi:hypothetical protein